MPLYKGIAERVMKRNVLNPNPVIGKFTWVSNGAKLQCKYGTTTSTLKITPESTNKKSEGKPLATIDDYKALKNVFPFGQCKKTSPPTPCMPKTIPFWTPMVPTRLAGPKQFPALAYPNATLTCTKGSRDCIKILTPGQNKEKVDEPQKSGCVEGNLSKSTQNVGQGASQTTKVGHVKACLNKSGLSMEVTGVKSTLTNGMGSSAQVQVGTASFSAGPGAPPSAGVHAIQGTASQVTPAGTSTTNAGFGVSAGSSNGFGPTFGVGHTLP